MAGVFRLRDSSVAALPENLMPRSGKVGRNMHRSARNVRRPMSGAKEKLIAFRVSDEMHEYLHDEAERRGISISALIRQSVLFMKSH